MVNFRQWVSPLVGALSGRWGQTYNDLTPEQKALYKELKTYFDSYGDSEYPDALAYINRNKLFHRFKHLFWKGGKK